MACSIIRYKQLRNGVFHSQVTGGTSGYQSIQDVACLHTVLSSKQHSGFIYYDYAKRLPVLQREKKDKVLSSDLVKIRCVLTSVLQWPIYNILIF